MPRLTLCCLFTAFWIWPANAGADDAGQMTMKFTLDGASVVGRPLLWAKSDAAVLGRDGRVWYFDPSEAKNLRRLSTPFEPHSVTLLRSRLGQEFGSAFEVTSAGHYLVVHPQGHGQEWSGRFEELYRSFRIYFSVRGFALDEPEFPLVAVVLRTRDEFQRYVRRERGRTAPGVLGYYSPITNRVIMYDVTGGRNSEAWYANAETIIHEATHQTAFNTGIHNRFASPPRWVAEGLGTMFEARGVWNSRYSTRNSERINRDRLKQFQQYRSRRKSDALVRLISSDRQFKSDADGAYAEAWALTYFLSETRPRQYADYLARTANRPNFRVYSTTERLADFTAVFGENLPLLDAQFVQFVEGLE